MEKILTALLPLFLLVGCEDKDARDRIEQLERQLEAQEERIKKQYEERVRCPRCRGRGESVLSGDAAQGREGMVIMCEKCNGTGWKW
jgi:DnaJ-class molecular chaperone